MRFPKYILWLGCGLLAGAGCDRSGAVPSPPWDRPENDWPVSPPPSGLVGEGFEIGQVVPDLRLVDQHGDVVSTWQFWGDLVLVSVSAVWCLPCQQLAVDAEHACADFAPNGVTLLTILEEDAGGLAPRVEDAAAWADMYGEDCPPDSGRCDSPVLVDPDHELSPALQGSYPAVLLLDRELVVVARARELSEQNLQDLIESEL